MTTPTLTPTTSGDAPWANFRPTTAREFIALRAAADPDVFGWLRHIAPAAGCTRPVRLSGQIKTIDAATGGLLTTISTADMPDGLIYKPCGNRRGSVCPSCARTYQRDAYQLLRAGLVGGKGVPETVSRHPSAFPTITAPSFGPVHARKVEHHTCESRNRCDCRAEPCHPRRDTRPCEHGRPAVCFTRHEPGDPVVGHALCLDCYDHDHQVVWNLFTGKLWHRTKQAAERHLAQLAKQRGIPSVTILSPTGTWRKVPPVRLSHGKAAEFQVRGAVHFHALVRLDGVDPLDPTAIIPPPAGFTYLDLKAAILHAVAHVKFTTPAHPDRPNGWPIAWGDQVLVKPVTLTGHGELTDTMVAGYLAKYATKSTEATGRTQTRITPERADQYADPEGDHTARLIDACWRLGRPTRTPVPLSQRPARPRPATELGPRWTCETCGTGTRLRVCPHCTNTDRHEPPPETTTGTEVDTTTDTYVSTSPDPGDPYTRLRRWAHMLGYGGHFLTKARRYSVTFALLRGARAEYRRATDDPDTGIIRTAEHTGEETTLIVAALSFAGAGWHNTGDAVLANTSAAMARARTEAARDALGDEHPPSAQPLGRLISVS